MSTGIWSAASGAVGKTSALDVAANNVANASTPGFRAEKAVFRQTLANAVDRTRGTESLRYAVTRNNVPDFRAGQIVETGRPLDVAIADDNGFFVVSTAAGERYTRAGSFRTSVDGTLVTRDGTPILGENRRPLQVDPTAPDVRFDREGQLYSGDAPVGKLLIVRFQNLGGLEKEGDVLLRARPEAGAPQPYEGMLESGAVEHSNSNAVQGMSTLVTLTREFEMITKVIEAFSQIDRKAATEIAGSR
jgi:flagellar basal body rod protein FlgG